MKFLLGWLLCCPAAALPRGATPLPPRPPISTRPARPATPLRALGPSFPRALAAAAMANAPPALAIGSGGTVLVGGIVEQIFREPTDVYYFVLAVIALTVATKRTITSVFEKAIAADKLVEEKGRAGAALINKLEAERLKRKRQEARQKVLEAEPATLARLQAEKKMRDEKRAKWTQFPGED
ncbi:hypothetical protein AB1Y20_021520 [Prymnesium parvum]|uniref:Uncharacterized protein n=1 Tax=Prymnesium parvum TaxID=97485 RepID=A0AB34JK23_PRYPA